MIFFREARQVISGLPDFYVTKPFLAQFVQLKKENMFLIPLDTENRWFRYHHLFQKLLVNQIKRHFSPEDINALHAQASDWFAENGLIEEALNTPWLPGM